MTQVMAVQTITGRDEFVSLRDEWNELVDSDHRATFFQRWEYQYHTWRFDEEVTSPCILLVRDDSGRLIGCAPMGARTSKIGIVQVRILEFASLRYCDYANFILRDGCEEEACYALACWFRDNFHQWDVIRLRPLREDSPILNNEDMFLKKIGRPYKPTKYSTAPYLKLDPDWAGFDESLSSSTAQSTRRKVRKLFRELDTSFEQIDGNSSLRKAVNDLMDLHQMRMSHKNQGGAFARPHVRECFLELMDDLGSQGMAKVHAIKYRGRPIASICTMEFRNTVAFFQSGFDPAFAHLSPGTVMHAMRINEAIDAGAVEYDFLDGAERYKYSWSNGERDIYSVDFSTGSLRARLYYGQERARIRLAQSERLRSLYLKFRRARN